MAPQSLHKMYVAGILERQDNRVLILHREGQEEPTREWQFLRGPIQPHEPPEAAMRRIARETLEVEIEIVVGQPPMVIEIDGCRVELRYFFCGIVSGQLDPTPDAPFRWVLKAHLREYDFDAPSRPVVEWLLES